MGADGAPSNKKEPTPSFLPEPFCLVHRQAVVMTKKTTDPTFRELEKAREFDRQVHIQKAMEAGLTREEAEAHADEDLADRDDTRP